MPWGWPGRTGPARPPLTPQPVRSAGPARRGASTSAPSRLCCHTSCPRPTCAACASASSICRCAATRPLHLLLPLHLLHPLLPLLPLHPLHRVTFTHQPDRPLAPCVHLRLTPRTTCLPFSPLQLKRYNKQGLEHNTHAVAAESLLLLKSAPAHNPTEMSAAVDAVHVPIHIELSDLSQVRSTLHLTAPLCTSSPLHLCTSAPPYLHTLRGSSSPRPTSAATSCWRSNAGPTGSSPPPSRSKSTRCAA